MDKRDAFIITPIKEWCESLDVPDISVTSFNTGWKKRSAVSPDKGANMFIPLKKAGYKYCSDVAGGSCYKP